MPPSVLLAAVCALGSPWSRGADVRYVAHQGEEHLAPSHSLAAYKLAVAHGCDYLKLDVRESKDGKIVLQHDADLKWTYGTNLVIATRTLAELRSVTAKPKNGYGSERIVTLEEAVVEARKLPGVWVDFKHFQPEFADRVFAILAAGGIPEDRVMVATWSKAALRYVRKAHSAAKTVAHTYIKKSDDGYHVNVMSGEAVCATLEDVFAALVKERDELGLSGFNMPCGYSACTTPDWMVRKMKSAGMWVSIWFVYDPNTGDYYRKAGADAFVVACKANTGCPVPDMMPIRGFCASGVGAMAALKDDRYAMIALTAKKVLANGDIELDDGLTLDGVHAALPRARKKWVLVDAGNDGDMIEATVRRILSAGREEDTIVGGRFGCLKKMAAYSSKLRLCNMNRCDDKKACSENDDENLVTQSSLSSFCFDYLPDYRPFKAYGYAHASGQKIIAPIGSESEARVAFDAGVDFAVVNASGTEKRKEYK